MLVTARYAEYGDEDNAPRPISLFSALLCDPAEDQILETRLGYPIQDGPASMRQPEISLMRLEPLTSLTRMWDFAARGGLGTSQEKATNHYKQNGANSRGIVSMRRSTLNQEDSFHEEIHPVFQAF